MQARSIALGLGTSLFAYLSFLETGKTGESVDTLSPLLERMRESLEARFALSALPPHSSHGATIRLLDPARGSIGIAAALRASAASSWARDGCCNKQVIGER